MGGLGAPRLKQSAHEVEVSWHPLMGSKLGSGDVDPTWRRTCPEANPDLLLRASGAMTFAVRPSTSWGAEPNARRPDAKATSDR
jgi:hypothetical protein